MKETIGKLEEIVESLEKKIKSNNAGVYIGLIVFIGVAFFLEWHFRSTGVYCQKRLV